MKKQRLWRVQINDGTWIQVVATSAAHAIRNCVGWGSTDGSDILAVQAAGEVLVPDVA